LLFQPPTFFIKKKESRFFLINPDTLDVFRGKAFNVTSLDEDQLGAFSYIRQAMLVLKHPVFCVQGIKDKKVIKE